MARTCLELADYEGDITASPVDISRLTGIGSGKGRKAAAGIPAIQKDAAAGAAYLIAVGSAHLDADEVRGAEELALRTAAAEVAVCAGGGRRRGRCIG